MKFIELNTVMGERIFININVIQYIETICDKVGTSMVFVDINGMEFFVVEETIDQIQHLIEN